MLTITYSGKSAPSAQRIADEDDDIFTNRGSQGDINWGREKADTELNPDIRNSTNKRVMRELFRWHGVPMPTLIDEYISVASGPFPFIGRPDYHSRGRGYWEIWDNRTLDLAKRGTRKKAAATHFMEYIDAPHEYRVHIFNGKSIRISEKQFNETSAGRHTSGYTTIKPRGPVKHVRRAAKQALEAVGLDFGAVDVLATDSDCWVLEVNAAPGLGGSMPALYAKVFKEWYDQR